MKTNETNGKLNPLSNKNLNPELKFDEVMQLYNHIAEEEHHFNRMELDYRKLALQLLLITFGAIGFILGKDFIVPNGLLLGDLIMIISFLSSIAILVIYIVDIKAYHGLLHQAFKQGIGLEIKYSQHLPPTRINMVVAAHNGEIVNWVVLFYFFSVMSLVVVANVAVYFSSFPSLYWVLHSLSVVVLIVLYMKIFSEPKEDEVFWKYVKNNQ